MATSINSNFLSVLVAVLFITLLTCSTKGSSSINVTETSLTFSPSTKGLVPVESTIYRVFNDGYGPYGHPDGQRRRLAQPFQLCLLCKCCPAGSDPGTCTSMPCCFGIDCQLPNKPFGVCAFVPKTCNCTSCAV